MKTLHKYICKYCKSSFQTRQNNAKYCSKRCAYDDRVGKPKHSNFGKKKTKKFTQFICEYCNQSFERLVYPSSKNQFRFCCTTCRNKARIWNGEVRHRSSNWKTCPVCGKQGWRTGDYCNTHRPRGKNKKPVSNPAVWTKDKLDFLKENYSHIGGKAIAEILKLEPKQVINKANSIGIKLTKEASHQIIHNQAKKYMLNNNPMKNEETKKKVLDYWNNHPEEKQIAYEKLVIGKQKIQRDKPTKLELKLFEYLSGLDVNFKPYFIVKSKFIVDVLVDTDLIIQADGDYWHGHPRYKNLTDRQLKQQARDKAQDKYLKTCGYTVVRIWESDISKELVKSILESYGKLGKRPLVTGSSVS